MHRSSSPSGEIEISEIVGSYVLARHVAIRLKEIIRPTLSDLEKEIQQERRRIAATPLPSLLARIPDLDRRRRYENAKWRFEEIDLSKIWVWPQMGNIFWASGKAIDVASKFRTQVASLDRFTITQGKIETIQSICTMIEHLDDELPVHIFASPGIHRSYDNARGHHDDFYDVDDGCHRTLAAVIAKKVKIKAYVGKLNRLP